MIFYHIDKWVFWHYSLNMVNTADRIRRRYYLLTGSHTLAASVIWGVNTLFLVNSGLSIFQAFLANAVFTASMTLFEIPTGAVADARGRRNSLCWSAVFLFVGTLGYGAAGSWGWGIWGFAGASVLLGVGYTFFSGAAEAWVVDELKAVGDQGDLEALFARNGITASITMLLGTILGGFLGTIDLRIPYAVRAVFLLIMLGFTLFGMPENGWKPDSKPKGMKEQIRMTARDSLNFGWRVRPLRLLMSVSFLQGAFLMWGFYALQPYVTQLANNPGASWIAGIVTALVALSQMGGQALAGRKHKQTSEVGRRLISGISISVLGAVLVGLAGIPSFINLLGSMGSLALVLGGLSLMMGSLGYCMPLQRSALHSRVPSAKRATIISLDSLLGNGGAIIGQPLLGRITDMAGFSAGYFSGALSLVLTLPLLRKFNQEERKEAAG